MITEELMPVLYEDYNISRDPEMHGIGGSSSGAIAAFGVAWARPDAFRKVLSNVGSFINMRGGNAYADSRLQTKRKPLRVFLADGRNDHRGRVGAPYDTTRDWFYQNVRLLNALTQEGLRRELLLEREPSRPEILRAILPAMMRWLWRDAIPVEPSETDVAERGLLQPTARP